MPVGRGSFRERASAASDEPCPGHPNILRRSNACPQKLRAAAPAVPAAVAAAVAARSIADEACPGHPNVKASSEACLATDGDGKLLRGATDADGDADGGGDDEDALLSEDGSVTVGSGPAAQHIVARALRSYPVLRPVAADEAAAALVSALRVRLDNATHTAVATFARPMCFDRFPGQ
eukprot:scaffold42377_cov63-Phaeocystis_antarctica.AAC.1